MSQAADLYQEIILHYSRSPRHFEVIQPHNYAIKADNPLCGDSYTLYFQINAGGLIENAGFQGAGCAISKASTSLMLDAVIGKPIETADSLFQAFHQMVKQPEAAGPNLDKLGKLAAFSGVWKYPSRVKCAILAWHAMHEIIQQGSKA